MTVTLSASEVDQRFQSKKATARLQACFEVVHIHLRHDKSISHGHDGGVAFSVMLNEFRIGAGGNSCRPHAHTASELIEMRDERGQQVEFPGVLPRMDQSLALRAIQRHRRRGRADADGVEEKLSHEAPRLYHGATYCNIGPILEHGILPGRVTDSGRSDIFFSAALSLVTIKGAMVEGYFRDFGNRVDVGSSDNDNPTTLETWKFDSEIVAVVGGHTQNSICRGCKFPASDSHAI